jgi:hypothetical protein
MILMYIAMLFLILEEFVSPNNRFNWFWNNRLRHIKKSKESINEYITSYCSCYY